MGETIQMTKLRRDDDSKLKERGLEVVDWIYLALDRG
jgi:hypothetical protein